MSHTNTLLSLFSTRQYFNSGATRDYKFRIRQLKNLRDSIMAHEEEINQALYADLHKSVEEVWITEIGFVLAEISNAIRNLKDWMQPQYQSTNLANLPGSSYVLHEPLGVVLIISPWNYPLQLLLNPLVGAIAAGNCAVLKPSELAPATEKVIEKIISKAFAPEYISCVVGDGAALLPTLLSSFRFDHIFFTGSTKVGKQIYKMAAEQLVPVTLELGGKSPCVVDEDAAADVAAKRIAMTKFSNAGQMCVAPDYILVHHSKAVEFVEALKAAVQRFFGDDPAKSEEYGRIINESQYERLLSLMKDGDVIAGGQHNREEKYIAPTILGGIAKDAAIMKEEIFGPLLPIIPFTSQAEALSIIAENPNPLAFYIFSGSKEKQKAWIEAVPFGGGCVNNAALHLTNHALPFGGRGFSGTGQYHGRYSFDTFSHKKAVMQTPTWFDPSMKYPPFKGKLKLLKKLIR